MNPHNFFMLRRPLWPLKTLLDFHKTARDPADFETRLVSLFEDPVLSEGLFTASPGLHEALAHLRNGDMKQNDRLKLLAALYRYLIRLCSRATPYGLFAGIASGVLASGTSVRFDGKSGLQKTTRLDGKVLSDLATSFLKVPSIQTQIRYLPNSSLQTLQGYYRYTERKEYPEGSVHVLSEVESNPEISSILEDLKELPRPAASLPSSPGRRSLIKAMHEAQLIVSDLEQTVTGEDFLNVLMARLRTMKKTGKQLKLLHNISHALNGRQFRSAGPPDLRSLLTPFVRTEAHEPLIQTDIAFPAEVCQVSRQSIHLLAREFQEIEGLLLNNSGSADLDNFRKDFFRKFENREVPLLAALDSESGIGYGQIAPGLSDDTPLLDGIRFPPSENTSALRPASWQVFTEQILEKARATRSLCVRLNDAGIEFPGPAPAPSWEGLYWLGSIFTRSQEAFDRGDFRFLLRTVGGPSGFELLGRFCHLDAMLEKKVRNAMQTHQTRAPDVLYAEIAHLPAARTANILSRPHLRDYEIVYLAGSTLPVGKRIYPSDLVVSVPNGGEVILRSKRLGKRVIPRMATAHNHRHGLPLYKFLCDVAGQGKSYAWDWGHLSGHAFLPRIEYGHWLISRATWHIEQARFPPLFNRRADFNTEWSKVRRLLQIPRYVQLCHGDNELLIDSEYPFALTILKDTLYKTGRAKLVEIPGSPAETCGFLQGYTHEIVIPFDRDPTPVTAVQENRFPRKLRRDFPPGSPWLYIKVYCGTQTAERLLTGPLSKLLRQLTGSGTAEKWFFIRYADPEPHLRIRLHNSTRPGFWQEILGEFNQTLTPLLAEGIISKVQNDTYSRELERYHGPDFEQTESIFHADSDAVLEILHVLSENTEDHLRWMAGIMGVDRLFCDFGISLREKLALAARSCQRLTAEFDGSRGIKVQLDAKYRRDQPLVRECLDMLPAGQSDPVKRIDQILRSRSGRIRDILKAPLKHVTPEVASSFAHMFLNRLFLSRPRQQELVLYHYLQKYYLTLLKRC